MTELLKAIQSRDILLLWGIIFSMLATFWWRYPKYWHKRYRSHILLSVFLFCIILTFFFSGFLSVWIASIFLVPWAIYVFIAYYATTKPIFPETRALSRFENLVREGRYTEAGQRFPKRPFYISSIPGKIKWDLLWAKKLMGQQKLNDAYEIYYDLLTLPLFDEERNNIRLKQVLVLWLLGDTNKAKSTFEKTKQKITHDKYYESLHLQSLFDERAGEFEKARQSLLSAIAEYDNVKDRQLALIYNNLGRMAKMLGNTTDAFHYYRKSAELANYFKEKAILHVVYPNIIDTYLLYEDNKNAALFLDKYSNVIDKDNIDDLLKFNNYMLEYARQTENKVLFLDALTKGRIEILPKISYPEKLAFEISELRIRYNAHCGWDEKLFWIGHYLPEYLKLEFPDRYLTLKEVFNILRDLTKTNNLGPFAEIFSKLLAFMGQSKEDIDRYLLDLPDYCVYERCFWEKERAFLRKIQKNDEPRTSLIDLFEGVFEHLRNIKDIQLQHGNPLFAIEADLNIADECMGVICDIRGNSIVDYLRKNLLKHLNDACKDLEKFRRHPVSNEYIVRIARYALFLGEKKRAKEYYNDFVHSKISIYHYASWIQKYYEVLNKEFQR